MTASLLVNAPEITPDQLVFRHDVLRAGTAAQAGLLAAPVAAMRAIAESYLVPTADHPDHPAYAGATVLAARNGVVVQRFAVGDAVRYAAADAELPPEQRIPARVDTIYDLASISKLFTTIVVLQQVEKGRLDLDAPVAEHVPEFGKPRITVRHLLTHTSGLPAFLPFWSSYPTPETRLTAALATPVAAGTKPGAQYVYSDIGLIVLGVLAERVTGKGLAQAVHDGVTGPLAMRDTGFNPAPETRDRIAATEVEAYAGRGLVWGVVHDENAWSLGGVAGHAGVFSTVDDLAILCQTLLNGGAYRGTRILSERMVRAALVNYNEGIEDRFPDSDRGLGFELGKHSYMDAMASPVTFGHTGFTGTSVVIDPIAHSFLILLSNRVHPDRNWGTNTVARRALARTFAEAIPIGHGWHTAGKDNASLTLVGHLPRPAPIGAIASFLLWYDTEPRYDTAHIETSADGGASWRPLPMTLRAGHDGFTSDGSLTGYGGRKWWHVTAAVPAGTTDLRWSYRTDVSARGRGVHLDHVHVTGSGAPDMAADGWTFS
ncbi:serine hydrolase [Actinoplanes sp. TBRC 11911]|uniref:serine hydrolase n=1 Tax=Actinoplanes sp. TBRC 11911 TaxID=2729386 RepID=UPI00145C8B4A|nr:serine hydrolase [Actinoplanes sp. TBRC 11911]NMO53285.1 serine hydrolase [Actinoplanes sp. TBRC 11911]